MKRILSLLLVLLLAASLLPAGALAADAAVVLSPQNLRVDGKRIDCEKYNIDGSNYFKLRDIAYLVSGTGSQFSVGWDGEKKVISVVTGEAYEPNGSELDLSGGDKSESAQPSTQTLLINGVERGDLSAYNIGGNNYFKLRDLGEALGFRVDYDKPSNTAIVVSRAWSEPPLWRIAEYIETSNSGSSRSVSTYDENGRPISSWFQEEYYTERYDYFYNDLGYPAESAYEYASREGVDPWSESRRITYEYDIWGQLVKTTTVTTGSGDDTFTEELFTYDDDGKLLTDEIRSAYGTTVYSYTYDERGDYTRIETVYPDGSGGATEYVRDEEGQLLRWRFVNLDGAEEYAYEYEYEGGQKVRETYVAGDYRTVTAYTYDERGNLISRRTEDSGWISENTFTYDEENRILSSVYYNGCDLFTTINAYDAEGRLLHTEYTSPDEDHTLDYTYDAEGNPLSVVYVGSDCTYRTDYTYDTAEGKKTVVTVYTYPPATELQLSDEELVLAVGDETTLLYYFNPYNAQQESVSWSSSDESVVRVDEDGNVFAVGRGSAVVTAVSESGLTAQCSVIVAQDKYRLTVVPEELVIGVNDTLSIRCTVEYVGVYRPYKLRFEKWSEEDSVLFLMWREWDGSSIDLSVTALEAGTETISVMIISLDGGTVYDVATVTVTVRG